MSIYGIDLASGSDYSAIAIRKARENQLTINLQAVAKDIEQAFREFDDAAARIGRLWLAEISAALSAATTPSQTPCTTLQQAAQKAQARRRYKAACRAVGIVNQLTPGPYRGYHASRVFAQKNTLKPAAKARSTK